MLVKIKNKGEKEIMKKRILSIVMAVVMVASLTGCTKTKTVSYTDENGNTTTTTTTTDKEGTTTVTENTDVDGNVTSHEEDGYITASLKFVNLSGVDIYELYIVPDYSDNWGENIISEENAPLADGEFIKWNDAFTYSENDLIWDIRAIDSEGEEMNFGGLDVSQAEDKNNIEFTFEYSEQNGYTASVIGPINQEPEYSVVESDEGYRVTYNPDWIEYVDDVDADIDDSVYFRCIIDEENMYENYMDVRLVTDYTAEDFIAGIAHQSGSDSTETFEGEISFANATYHGYGCTEVITDTFNITTYAFQSKNGAYVIEIGSHIYSDDDEYAYKVSGAMEELFLTVELDM